MKRTCTWPWQMRNHILHFAKTCPDAAQPIATHKHGIIQIVAFPSHVRPFCCVGALLELAWCCAKAYSIHWSPQVSQRRGWAVLYQQTWLHNGTAVSQINMKNIFGLWAYQGAQASKNALPVCLGGKDPPHGALQCCLALQHNGYLQTAPFTKSFPEMSINGTLPSVQCFKFV